jgi:carboxyl-terminal processing protease
VEVIWKRRARVRRGRLIKPLVLAIVAVLSIMSEACATRRPPADPKLESALALETFDKAWSLIYESHFDPEFNGVDWEALRDELRPQVEQIESEKQLRAIIRDMLSRLNQSHFALLPRDTVDGEEAPAEENSDESDSGVGVVGFDFRLIDEQLLVTDIDEGGAAERAGIRPGWALTAIGDREIRELLERIQGMDRLEGLNVIAHAMVTERLTGAIGSEVKLTFQDTQDESSELTLERDAPPGESIQFGNLPPFMSYLTTREPDTDDPNNRVGVIYFNVWMIPLAKEFDVAVDRFREHDGIIIDLRGNPGGVGGMVMGISGHFLDEKVSLGTFQTRTTTLKFMSNPRRVNSDGKRVTPYGGPVAVLIDGLSASTSEVFAGGMQGVGRAKIFGTRSAGMALPALMERLPNRDVLYHAFASFTTPDGSPIEGRGIVPDEEIALTREDLLTGRDPVLDAALIWIASETNPT